jgi:hypothetical protein
MGAAGGDEIETLDPVDKVTRAAVDAGEEVPEIAEMVGGEVVS